MQGNVKRVARFSTGTVDIHPQHAYRGRSPLYWWILTSRRWLTSRPINVYVIEHSDGVVLFDTGQDRASVTEPCYFPGGATGVLFRRLARFRIDEHETLTGGLERLGYRPSDVRTAVISHLHQDHIGGLREIPDADCGLRAAMPASDHVVERLTSAGAHFDVWYLPEELREPRPDRAPLNDDDLLAFHVLLQRQDWFQCLTPTRPQSPPEATPKRPGRWSRWSRLRLSAKESER